MGPQGLGLESRRRYVNTRIEWSSIGQETTPTPSRRSSQSDAESYVNADYVPCVDYDHEPIHRRAKELLRDPRIGPVLYWDLQNQNHCPDGDKYQATAWRTIPDYQGGECQSSVLLFG
jgi:hypothetical protein